LNFFSLKILHQFGIFEFKNLREMEFYNFLYGLTGGKSEHQKNDLIKVYPNENFVNLKINDLKVCFVSLMLGTIISILIILLEFFYFRRIKCFNYNNTVIHSKKMFN
jgi:hypothetical protein